MSERTETTPPRPERSGHARILRGAATGAAIVGVIVVLVVRGPQTRAALGSLSVPTLLALLAVSSAQLVVQAYRYWLVLVTDTPDRVPFLGWLRIFVLGRVLNVTVAQGGAVYRAVELKERYGVPYGEFVAVFVGYSWLSAVLNLVLAAIVLAFAGGDVRLAGLPALPLVIVLAFAAAAGPPALARVIPRYVTGASFLRRMAGRGAAILHRVVEPARSRAILGRFFAVGIVSFALSMVAVSLAFASVGARTGLAQVAVFIAFVQLINQVVLTPANLGIAELTFGGLAEAMGIGLVPGVLASAINRAAAVAALLVMGAVLGAWRQWRAWRRTRVGPQA